MKEIQEAIGHWMLLSGQGKGHSSEPSLPGINYSAHAVESYCLCGLRTVWVWWLGPGWDSRLVPRDIGVQAVVSVLGNDALTGSLSG